MALHIKGINYKYHNVELLKFEHLEPWYLKMNPGGVVPTLKHGYNIVPESDEILRYLDVHFSKLAVEHYYFSSWTLFCQIWQLFVDKGYKIKLS